MFRDDGEDFEEARSSWNELNAKDRADYVKRVRVYRKVWIQGLDPDTDPDDMHDTRYEVLSPEELFKPIHCSKCKKDYPGLDAFTDHLKQPNLDRHIQCPVKSFFFSQILFLGRSS